MKLDYATGSRKSNIDGIDRAPASRYSYHLAFNLVGWPAVFENARAHFCSVRLYWAVALFSFVAFRAVAQVTVDSWTAENGLPQNIIRAICQTPDGYLWLATFDGLVRFDGIRFRTFNRSNTAGIAGNRFGSLFCTVDGDIWAGTEGSGVTRYHSGAFTTYTVRDGLTSNTVLGITEGGGNLWMLVRNSVVEWRPADQRFIPVKTPEGKYFGVLSSDGRAGFWKLGEKAFYVLAHGKRMQYSLPPGWGSSVPPIVGVDLGNRIWLATQKGQRSTLVNGRWSNISSDSAVQSASHPRAGSRSAYRDSEGNVWYSNFLWSPITGWVQYLELPPATHPARIAFNTLFEDREHNIWLSTEGQGLFRLHTPAIQVYSKAQGVSDPNVYSVYQSPDKAIWFGTRGGGLCRLKDEKITTFTSADGLTSNAITAIFEDRSGVLWVGTETGLACMRNDGAAPKRPFRNKFGITGDALVSGATIRAIHQDPQGAMWFGCDEGLIRLSRQPSDAWSTHGSNSGKLAQSSPSALPDCCLHETGRWTLFTKKDGLATDDVRVIIDGRDGALWVAGYGGLSWLHGGQVRTWTDHDGLPSNSIRALYEDGDGVLWIGTYDGGLGRFEKGKFTKYTVEQGLFNNGVFQILEDSRSNLWMSSNRGIYRVSKRQLNEFAAGKTSLVTSIAYGKSDGMRNVECNGGLGSAGVKTQDGRLWFATQDGVAVIDPEKLEPSPRPPPVAIETCLIDRTPAVMADPVRLTAKNESVEIQYTGLSLTDPERIRFKYRMRGLDSNWVDAGMRRTAYYSHLPPGTYRFEVTAAHSDGEWSYAGASLALVVLPRFYQTRWFALSLSALGCASLWLAWRYRLGQLERARAAQQAFSRQLIASQEKERKRIAAELHDSLGQQLVIIKNLALLLLQPNGASGLSAGQCERIQEISEAASGAAREVREISYNLRPYRLDRLGLTAALRGMIETASEAGGICVSADIDNIDGVLPREMEIDFYRILQECINNLLKHSKASYATVQIEHNQGRLNMTVRDDGQGFSQSLSKPDSSSGGFGLTGICERAQLLGGRASIRSTPGQGTTIAVEIPSHLRA